MTMLRSPADPSDDNRTGVAVSEELFAPVGNGVELCYQAFGDPEDEPLLLVMGLGGPMNWWDPQLCELLAREGFHVVRFDNRDTGRSSKVGGRVTRTTIVKAFLGMSVRSPYTMSDLAEDALGLMDHLGWDSAHVCGVSMGGMIVQTMAINAPERVRSLTSIMSSTGRRTVGWQHPSLLPALIGKRGVGRDAYVASSSQTWQMIASPGFPVDEDKVRERAAETWDRGFSAQGVLRQMLAVLTQPNRTRDLRSVTVPATVVHGLADKMVHVSGGRATSSAIAGSELLLVEGMGHDLPVEMFETFAEVVRRTADRVGAT
jgi:pimeloyl-ACP methyl ester carboxylesterase